MSKIESWKSIVAVGSLNPIKIVAVKAAFYAIWPGTNWDVVGVEVASMVSSQPMSDLETIDGARYRARVALETISADFGVGLEGGLQQIGDQWFESGWIIVLNRMGKEGIGSSIRMIVPTKMMDLIQSGSELGAADDIFFKRRMSGREEGHFGLMTNNSITREHGYRDGVISAMIRFLHPHLFE